MSWIRPEDIHYYEPYVSVMKLATRSTPHPEVMLKAYAEGHYDGDLMTILGAENPYFTIDNSRFPVNWVESGIAQGCAANCSHCGKCEMVLKAVQKARKQPMPQYTLQ